MDYKDIKVGEHYALNKVYPEFCNISKGDPVCVFSRHKGADSIMIAWPFSGGYWTVKSEDLDVPLTEEQKLRKKIAAEVLQVWPDKKGIAAMIECGGPEAYAKACA